MYNAVRPYLRIVGRPYFRIAVLVLALVPLLGILCETENDDPPLSDDFVAFIESRNTSDDGEFPFFAEAQAGCKEGTYVPVPPGGRTTFAVTNRSTQTCPAAIDILSIRFGFVEGSPQLFRLKIAFAEDVPTVDNVRRNYNIAIAGGVGGPQVGRNLTIANGEELNCRHSLRLRDPIRDIPIGPAEVCGEVDADGDLVMTIDLSLLLEGDLTVSIFTFQSGESDTFIVRGIARP